MGLALVILTSEVCNDHILLKSKMLKRDAFSVVVMASFRLFARVASAAEAEAAARNKGSEACGRSHIRQNMPFLVLFSGSHTEKCQTVRYGMV